MEENKNLSLNKNLSFFFIGLKDGAFNFNFFLFYFLLHVYKRFPFSIHLQG